MVAQLTERAAIASLLALLEGLLEVETVVPIIKDVGAAPIHVPTLGTAPRSSEIPGRGSAVPLLPAPLLPLNTGGSRTILLDLVASESLLANGEVASTAVGSRATTTRHVPRVLAEATPFPVPPDAGLLREAVPRQIFKATSWAERETQSIPLLVATTREMTAVLDEGACTGVALSPSVRNTIQTVDVPTVNALLDMAGLEVIPEGLAITIPLKKGGVP